MNPTRASALAIYLAALVLAAALVAYGARLVQQVRDAGAAWSLHITQAAEAEETLHEVIHHFGYGGFIHHFKDYVLGHAPGLAVVLEEALTGTRLALDQYTDLQLTPAEEAAVDRLRRVVDDYAARVELVGLLREQGLSSREIDRRVRVDDAPALDAIAVLDARARRVLESNRAQVDAALRDLIRQLWRGLVLLIPIALVSWLLVRDRRLLREANAQAEQAKRYVDELVEGVPDPLLVVAERGAIVRTNIAAEKLLGYSREELLALTVEDLMPPRLREGHAALRDHARATANDQPFRPGLRVAALTHSGREVPVEISLSHSRRDDTLLTIATLRDVSERERLQSLLEERQEALETAQSIAHIGSWDWRIMSNELSWSDETYRIFGYEPGAIAADYDAFLHHVHAGDRDRVAAAVSQALEHGVAYEIEHRIVRPGGEERVVRQRAEVFRADGGTPVRMIGTVLDVTERKETERELLFDQAIIQGLSQPILVVDGDMRIVDLNDAFCQMSGYARDEALGRAPSLLKSGRHGRDFYEAMWRDINDSQCWRGEIWNRRKDGVVMPQLLSITRICEPSAGLCRYVGFYSDITSLKANEARLEKLAHFDQLTGLANRMLCKDRLRAAIARAHRAAGRMAVLFVDLDGFKQVNDRLGHQTGDMLLVEVAERMKRTVREDDTVARLGGDEFAVVLNEVGDQEEVRHLAERVLHAVEVTLGAGVAAVSVSGSIGIACYPEDGEDAEQLLKRADEAMYRAKQAGKARFCFHGDT